MYACVCVGGGGDTCPYHIALYPIAWSIQMYLAYLGYAFSGDINIK